MTILGIETSCDETAAAVIQSIENSSYLTLLSNVVTSSMDEHAKTGGIIPEAAARNQILSIIPIIKKALTDADITFSKTQPPAIDAIAVTVGPGLIGSLLVGVETAKTLAMAWNKPLIPVNHLFGHIYANWIKSNQTKSIIFPALALIVSGGHTDLVLMKTHKNIQWLGGTKDDAAGEAIDKIGRTINFPYPAGPAFEKAAASGNPKAYHFPRPIMYDKAYDFSFSGLKTAALREINKLKQKSLRHCEEQSDEAIPLGSALSIHSGIASPVPELVRNDVYNIARGVQDAIVDVLVYKTMQAAKQFDTKSILLGGGVASNQILREQIQKAIDKYALSAALFVPDKKLCVDNGAMIAAAAYYISIETPIHKISANPELYFD